jgi:hypothetical protein
MEEIVPGLAQPHFLSAPAMKSCARSAMVPMRQYRGIVTGWNRRG